MHSDQAHELASVCGNTMPSLRPMAINIIILNTYLQNHELTGTRKGTKKERVHLTQGNESTLTCGNYIVGIYATFNDDTHVSEGLRMDSTNSIVQ